VKRFLIYYGRWILSAFVMMPFMIAFEKMGLSLSANLIAGQTVGALIFYRIDKWIFKEK